MPKLNMEIIGQKRTQMLMRGIIIKSIIQVLNGIILSVKQDINSTYYENTLLQYFDVIFNDEDM